MGHMDDGSLRGVEQGEMQDDLHHGLMSRHLGITEKESKSIHATFISFELPCASTQADQRCIYPLH